MPRFMSETGKCWRCRRPESNKLLVPELFVQEQIALHDFANETLDTVVTRTGALENLLDLGAVGEAHRSARRIDGQLLGEIAGNLLFVVEEQLFQFANV